MFASGKGTAPQAMMSDDMTAWTPATQGLFRITRHLADEAPAFCQIGIGSMTREAPCSSGRGLSLTMKTTRHAKE